MYERTWWWLLTLLVSPLVAACSLSGPSGPGEMPGRAPPGATPTATATTPTDATAAEGYRIFAGEGGCAACHTIEGLFSAQVGPDLSDIGNHAGERQLLTSAEEYLTESIRDPEAYVATQAERGVPGLMTSEITGHLSDVQVEALVAFLLEQKRPEKRDSPVPTPFPPPSGPVTIKTGIHPQLGRILVDGQDRAVYLYGGDGRNQSTCTEECARVWPPVRTRGDPQADEGANPDMLGSIERGDGLPQVTYSQKPLYYFVQDPETAAATGHELEDKWGLWLALAPSGEPAHATMPGIP